MDAQSYLPPGASVQTLATMEKHELGRILIFAFAKEAQRRDRTLKSSPQFDAADIRKDVRHKLGEIDGLSFLGKLHEAAQNKCGAFREKPGATEPEE